MCITLIKPCLVAFELLADTSAVIWTNQSVLRSVDLLSRSDSRLNSWAPNPWSLSSWSWTCWTVTMKLWGMCFIWSWVSGVMSSCCGTRRGCGGLCSSEQCQNLWGDFRRPWLGNVLCRFREWPLRKVNMMHKMIHQGCLFSVWYLF